MNYDMYVKQTQPLSEEIISIKFMQPVETDRINFTTVFSEKMILKSTTSCMCLPKAQFRRQFVQQTVI